MIRGFVTLATGDEEYYRLASNLLSSFRLFDQETPFAIICDRENQYTKAFTDTVILKDANRNYLDKLSVLTSCPYDENIFIESDCLVYHNLNHFWKLLSGVYDLTSFGGNDCEVPFLENPKYAAEKLLGDRDALISTFNPGYFFVRRGETCNKIYVDAIEMARTIFEDPVLRHEPWLFCKNNLRDDPLIWLAMTKNGCRCIESPFVGKCVFLPSIKKIDRISLSQGKLDAFWFHPLTDCNILHFSTRRVKQEGLYLHQTIVLRLLEKGHHGWYIRILESKPVWFLFDFGRKNAVKIKNKLKRAN